MHNTRIGVKPAGNLLHVNLYLLRNPQVIEDLLEFGYILRRMRHPRIRRRRIEQRLIRLAALDGALHRSIDFQDDTLGAILAMHHVSVAKLDLTGY